MHQTIEVLLRCAAALAVPPSARCLPATAESRAEMAGVDRVPPEGILSLPIAAAPQLLAMPLHQRRHDKVKTKRGKTIVHVSVCVREKKGGRVLCNERQHCSPPKINTNVINHQQAHKLLQTL